MQRKRYCYPVSGKKGKKNTEYVLDAWLSNLICTGYSLRSDGATISILDHVVGITTQRNHKILFNCARYKRYITKMNSSDYRLIPFCPSCGEVAPNVYLESLRKL